VKGLDGDEADDRRDTLEDMADDELRRYSEALIEPIVRAKAVDRGPAELVTFDVA
jgi:hypothetical protein